MSEFLAKARMIQREKGCSFCEACSILGRASGRKRTAKARAKKKEGPKREDWHRRWERERERMQDGNSDT